jgi:hypothetical protein
MVVAALLVMVWQVMERGGSSVVGRGLAGYLPPTTLLPPRSNGKIRGR